MSDTFDKLRAILLDQVGPEEIRPDSRFVEDLNVDSLDAAGLVMEVEQKFGVSLPIEEAANLHTVGDAVAYIDRALAGQHLP